MRKFMVLAALVAMVVSALAIPALAQGVHNRDFVPQGFFNNADPANRGGDQGNRGENFQNFAKDFAPWNFFGADREDRQDNNRQDNNRQDNNRQDNNRQDNNWWDDDGNWWNNPSSSWWHDNNNDTPAVSQDFEQEADSGDVNQSFNVSNTGSNSNQCVGITGNANTGNAQNQIGVIQYGSEADDFGFFDSGASLNVNGTSTTTCDQQVNQAAAAG